jgi:uncharacterized membrane protein
MGEHPALREGARTGRRVLELRPRCSLTPQGARVFIGIVAGTTFGVGSLFALQGFWPVLPFAGLEIAVVWAVRASQRAGVERETIVISERWVTITRHGVKGEHCSVFPRHWAKVKLRAPPVALHPDSLVESGQGPFDTPGKRRDFCRASRLMLESHGSAIEVGRFLTEDERRSLAARLTQLVGNVNQSPARV